MTHYVAEDITRLHDHHELDAEGCPALAARLLVFLDDRRPAVPDPAERAEAADAWLARAHPELHAVLHLVTVEGLSHREAGRRLGLTHRTVGKRVDAALVKVRARCMAGETAA